MAEGKRILMQHGSEVPGESDRSIGGMARRLSFLPVWRFRVWLGSHTSMNVYNSYVMLPVP